MPISTSVHCYLIISVFCLNELRADQWLLKKWQKVPVQLESVSLKCLALSDLYDL